MIIANQENGENGKGILSS